MFAVERFTGDHFAVYIRCYPSFCVAFENRRPSADDSLIRFARCSPKIALSSPSGARNRPPLSFSLSFLSPLFLLIHSALFLTPDPRDSSGIGLCLSVYVSACLLPQSNRRLMQNRPHTLSQKGRLCVWLCSLTTLFSHHKYNIHSEASNRRAGTTSIIRSHARSRSSDSYESKPFVLTGQQQQCPGSHTIEFSSRLTKHAKIHTDTCD